MKFKMIADKIVGSIIVLLACNVFANEVPNPHQRVLFIGNSYSYYNNGIQNHLGGLVRSAGDWQTGKSRFRLSTLSGGRLAEHDADLANLILSKNANWDTVVLQAHSNEALHPKRIKGFQLALKNHVALIRKHDIEPVLFMTWAYQGDAQMSKALIEVYTQAAREHGVKLAPIGVAFAVAEQQLPQIDLFVPDVLSIDSEGALTYKEIVKHPSVAGTYLAACVFYALFYQRSPEGLTFTAGQTPEVAGQLQRLAWQVTSEFNAE